MADYFSKWTLVDICDLIADYPMASIISAGVTDCADISVSEMPMLLDLDADGQPVSLLGHFPLRNPHYAVLKEQPRAVFSFHGPNDYVSPSHAGKSDWAPTWNFATVRIVADVYFDDALTDEALERVVAHMERNQQEPWNLSALGARYEKLRSGVMGFRAQIRSVSGRFKLGQDESDVVFENILNQHSNEPLREWMIRMRGRQ